MTNQIPVKVSLGDLTIPTVHYQAASMRSAGLSFRTISDQLGLSYQAVQQWFDREELSRAVELIRQNTPPVFQDAAGQEIQLQLTQGAISEHVSHLIASKGLVEDALNVLQQTLRQTPEQRVTQAIAFMLEVDPDCLDEIDDGGEGAGRRRKRKGWDNSAKLARIIEALSKTEANQLRAAETILKTQTTTSTMKITAGSKGSGTTTEDSLELLRDALLGKSIKASKKRAEQPEVVDVRVVEED